MADRARAVRARRRPEAGSRTGERRRRRRSRSPGSGCRCMRSGRRSPRSCRGSSNAGVPAMLILTLAVQALLSLVALIGFRAALPERRQRPRPLVRVGGDAQPVLLALSRVPAVDADDNRFARRLPPARRVRRAVRRRRSRGQCRRVRPRDCRGACARSTRDPRRPRAVPVRAGDSREHARQRQRQAGVGPADQGLAVAAQRRPASRVFALSSAGGSARSTTRCAATSSS